MTHLHVSFTRYDRSERRVMACPTCGRRRRHVARHQLWYGWRIDCCGCGDAWEDGWRLERPFRRGWRREAIERAKRLWTELGTNPPGAQPAELAEDR